MSTDRRGFLKTLLAGGAASAIVPNLKAASKVEVREKIVDRVVREPFPQNINEEEMAIWLVLKEKRRREFARIRRDQSA